ncbi:hypothetical protein Glove_750g14 [Diversispora epigaea]|uniref:Uncharacterized protein n=1 Tax=Diversispora epigaea TaxID=1348612 RepID=A0A397G2V5_9GLOM|nr:hypothetical protein Glove_750g14 [Diversispora epigaea]
MTTEVIPTTPLVNPVKDEVISDTCLSNDDFSLVEKLSPEIELNRDDILEEVQPPPPYSQTCPQWDEMSIEQLLEKSREVITGHSEYLANGGDKKEKDGEMLEKITQVESLLQTILSDQTFAMHDLRSQLSDIHTVLKKMHDKQVTMTSEEVMKQVVTVKALTENIIASNEVNRQLDANKTDATTTKPSITSTSDINVSEEKSISDEICFNNPTVILTTPSNNVSQQPSRTTSRAPSRASSRPPSKSDSRAVSPNRTSSRSSSKQKRDQSGSTVPNFQRNDKIDEIPKINEDDDDDDEGSGDTSLDRMNNLLNSLINEATEAVETPIIGREKKLRRISNSNQGFDFSDINNALDALEEEDEGEDESSSSETEDDDDDDIVHEHHEHHERGRGLRREKDKARKRAMSRNEEIFESSMSEIGKSLDAFSHLVDEITTEETMVQEDYGLQYLDPTADLIRNPSENLADLDYFAQQCRILTRAFILPFLWATNNFMSESLQTTNNINNSRGVKSTLRTFMNLMYWTFLFTLGSLVLDAWLCEVAGRQVIRMVDSLKPAQPFGMIYEDGDYRSERRGSSDSRMLEEDKKKNVKFCTGLKIKAKPWKGEETEVVKVGGGGKEGKWRGINNTFNINKVRKFEEELFSDDSDELEIVDLDSSEDEESYIEDDNEEDLAHLLRQKITNEWLKRAGHEKNIFDNKDNYAKNNINNVSTLIEKSDIRENTYSKTSTLINKVNTYNIYNTYNKYHTHNAFTGEPEEYDMDDDDDDDIYDDINMEINIPGSFPPVNNKRLLLPSTIIDETKNIRQVKSVVLQKPKRNGPFGGSDGFWVTKTRKIKTRNMANRNMGHNRKSVSISISKNQSSKSLSHPKRSRRFSI